jgi:hypothetical protein
MINHSESFMNILTTSSIFLILSAFFLQGCAGLLFTANLGAPPEEIDLEEQVSHEPSFLLANHEVYDLRIDLMRAQRRSDDEGHTLEEVPYNPIGLSLGNGLFLDVNNNLSFSVLELLDLNPEEDFRIIQTSETLLGNFRSEYAYENGTYRIRIRSILPINLNQDIAYTDNGIIIEEPILTRSKVEYLENGLRLRGPFTQFELVEQANGYKLRGLWTLNQYLQDGQDLILGPNLTLTNNGTQLQLVSASLFGRDLVHYRIVRTPDKIVFFDRFNWPTQIEIGENQLRVTYPNRLIETYQLKSARGIDLALDD